MKYGMHNTMTAYPLYGWQKWFGWLINPFSRCQSRTMKNVTKDTQVLDVQVALKDGKWRGSHGFAWYDVTIYDIIDAAQGWNLSKGHVTYLRLGYDHHVGQKQDMAAFMELVEYLDTLAYVVVYEVYAEGDDGKVQYIRRSPAIGKSLNVFERYWSLTWAKGKVKQHWWLLPVLLPLPRLWSKMFRKEWQREFEDSGADVFMTDFI